MLTNDTDVDTRDASASRRGGRTALAGNVGARDRHLRLGDASTADGSYSYASTIRRDADAARRRGHGHRRVQLHGDRRHGAGLDQPTLTITITGTNDAPVAVADQRRAVTEGVNPGNTPRAARSDATGNVLTNDTDVDHRRSSTRRGGGRPGRQRRQRRYRHLWHVSLINTDGSYSYVDNQTATPCSSRRAPPPPTCSLHGDRRARRHLDRTTLTITINGTNDAPVAVADPATVTEQA